MKSSRMGHILRGGGFNPDGKRALVAPKQAQKLGRFLLNEGDILMCMTDVKSSMALRAYGTDASQWSVFG